MEALRPAAVPTLRFTSRSTRTAPRALGRARVQTQIAARRRRYSDAASRPLADLFGAAQRWGETLRTLPWPRATCRAHVRGRDDRDLDVPCTYDFEVAAARYLAALRDGDVPLELCFSGTVFHIADGRGGSGGRIGVGPRGRYRCRCARGATRSDALLPGQRLAAA